MSLRLIPSLPALVLLLAPLSGCVIELDGDLRGHLGRACFAKADRSTERITVDEPISRVVVEGGVGDIRVHAHDDAGAAVVADLYGDDGRPKLETRVVDEVLTVTIDCGPLDCCGADLDLDLPREVSLHLDHGVGDIYVEGLDGDVLVELGVGDIELETLSGDLDLYSGTGTVVGQGLRGTKALADLGTGDLELSWAPDAGLSSVEASLGVGSADLWVPSKAYDLELDTGVGDVEIDGITSDHGARARIAIDVGTGSIEIQGR